MFSHNDAERLRHDLAPMRFDADLPRGDLVDAYCDYYGLNFGSKQRPVHHSLGLLSSGGFEVVCQHFQVALSERRGTVFLLHGYFDHTGIYQHLIRHCLDAGLAVVIFDMPGHGLSSGTPASIQSFAQYRAAFLDCLALARSQQVAQPWVTMGQSTGGAIIMDSLQEASLATRFPCAAYLLLAPLLRPAHWTRSKLLFWLTRPFVSSSPRTFARNSHDEEFLDFLKRSDDLQSRRLEGDWVQAMIDYQRRFEDFPPAPSALHIIQGTGDGTVDWRYNLTKISEKFPASKTYLVAEAGHHLVNESVPYRTRVFTLIDEILVAAGV